MANSLLNLDAQNIEYGSGMKFDWVSIELINGSDKLPGLVAQQIQASITKQIQTVFEISSANYYTFDGRPSGTGSITNMVGPNSEKWATTIKTFADVCQPTTLKIGVTNKCGGGGAGTVSFIGGFLNSMSMSATSASTVITGQLGFTFVDVQE